MNPKLKAAYNDWRTHAPEQMYGRHAACCVMGHWVSILGQEDTVPLDDSLVCERELAWRRYVRIRDRNPAFMTHLSLA